MGDPETEVVIPRIKNDFIDLLKSAAKKELNKVQLEIDKNTATTVMVVSGGYPEAYEKGKEIHGLDQVKDSIVFHAGTDLSQDKIVTSGGRVLAFTSFGKDKNEALKKSYQSIDKICFDQMYFRKDIGFDL
jgi:phosphoribosylamine--glycine ligase